MRDPAASRQRDRLFTRGLLLGFLAGLASMFLLDPRTGRRRRALIRDKAVRLGNSAEDLIGETIPAKIDYFSGFAQGARHRLMGGTARTSLPDQDRFVTDRVSSIVFRDPDLPKGDININTVDQVVYLRGHVKDDRLVQEIEHRVRQVEGVRDVINLINRPEVDPSALRMAAEQEMH